MMNTIKAIKQIDRITGPVLLKLFPKAFKADLKAGPLKKILVIRPGGMGDALLLLPILKEIASSFHVTIDILCEPRNKSVFKSVIFINRIFSYRDLKSMLSVFQKKYDAVFDTEQSHFLSAIITRLLRADIKIGFKTNGREKMYSKSINYTHQCYEAKMFWKLFSSLYLVNNNFHFNFPYFKQHDHYQNPNFKRKQAVCLFPGATIDERLWPEERWAKVIDWLADHGWHSVLLGSKKEKGQCKKIISMCKTNKIINMCSRLSILQTSWFFKRASLLITTDSGMLHLGVLSGLPTISLFGSGIKAKWAPTGKQHITIYKNLECSPCTKFGTTPPCPNNYRCMVQITPEEVIAVAHAHLS
ncbi:MAG: glycosyltransferase family 9 protein [Deltaproteobacteria bacterium]|nr:glycosyltransferase family 9 protein [Deltaproteobacteria bacterium]